MPEVPLSHREIAEYTKEYDLEPLIDWRHMGGGRWEDGAGNLAWSHENRGADGYSVYEADDDE